MQYEANQAIEQLYSDHHPAILRYLEGMTGNREAAEDLAHETFLKALRYWETLTSHEGVVGWLFRIAKNTAYDYFRRQRVRAGEPLTEVHAETVGTEDSALRIAENEPIWAALDRMSVDYRTALLLHSYAGMPVDTIANTLGWKLGTVKSRLSRAREQFRKYYVA